MMTMTTINYSEGLSRPTFDDDFSLLYKEGITTQVKGYMHLMMIAPL